MTSRIYAYCRVSTDEQTVENQKLAIKAAGYDIPDNRLFSETTSGAKPAMQREQFSRLVDRLEEGDTIVVLKLDRLGRDVMDIQYTIDELLNRGIKVKCLDLDVDFSSAAGRLMLQMLGAISEFERNRIRERTKEGLQRAKKEGKKVGRPPATETRKQVQASKASGLSQSKTATTLGLSLATVKRHWN